MAMMVLDFSKCDRCKKRPWKHRSVEEGTHLCDRCNQSFPDQSAESDREQGDDLEVKGE